MKSFILLIGMLAMVVTKEPETCAVCRQGTEALMVALNNGTSLAKQEQMIIEEICLNNTNAGDCATGILTWWRRMASAIYTEESAAFACHALDPACQLHNFTM